MKATVILLTAFTALGFARPIMDANSDARLPKREEREKEDGDKSECPDGLYEGLTCALSQTLKGLGVDLGGKDVLGLGKLLDGLLGPGSGVSIYSMIRARVPNVCGMLMWMVTLA